MNTSENRQVYRDSLFLMADLRVQGEDGEHRIKVRNLSSGGMMGEGRVRISRGMLVEVNIRNIGWVVGAIAWVQDDRFGVAFRDEIDPKRAREPVVGKGDEFNAPRYTRQPLPEKNTGIVRKI